MAAGVTNTKARTKKDLESHQLTDDQNNQMIRLLGQDVPLGGLPNQPDDVAHSLLYLGSDDAAMITGEIMVVDGG